jgi:predicted dehydrogenase
MHADSGTAAWNPDWRTDKRQSGGGILVDTGAHYLYLACALFGEPSNVTSVLKTLKHSNYSVEDTAIVTLEYDDKLVQLNLTWAASSRANTVWITGTKGTLSYTGTSLHHSSDGGSRDLPMPDISDKRQYVAWYVALFQEFSRRVREHDVREDLLEEAAMVMRLLDLSYRRSAADAPRETV